MLQDKHSPFLISMFADHPDTSAPARRLANVLKRAGVTVGVFGARESSHNKINADLAPDDPGTKRWGVRKRALKVMSLCSASLDRSALTSPMKTLRSIG
jgi:hypothetical protein